MAPQRRLLDLTGSGPLDIDLPRSRISPLAALPEAMAAAARANNFECVVIDHHEA
ncbi:hypothetical protein PQQ53_32210 [Paraburkholderia strydomiana]|jgi:alcohol dehydrogenase|uniref:hypothetical protein n=1 Tax=Paraburkholderia strydomiana TaxID=1245417 RepID=UPI0038BADA31